MSISRQITVADGATAKINTGSTSAPTVSNDNTQGYGVGSTWTKTDTGQIWICRDASTNAAVWLLLELSDHPGYIASSWYIGKGPSSSVSGGGTAPGTGSIRLHPVYIKERITVGTLGLRITTAAAAGNVQAAIYANNAATGRPTGAALVSTVSMSTTSTGNVNAAASLQLGPGLYWLATNSDNATVAFGSVLINDLFMAQTIGAVAQNIGLNASGAIVGLSVSQTFNTWPDLTAGSFSEVTTNAIPLVQFQITSAP